MAVDGCDGDERLDGESIVEADGGVVRIIVELVEERGGGYGFATTGVSQEGDVVHIHFLIKRIAWSAVPGAPLFQMFEQHPSADGLLFGRIVEQSAVEEVFVNRSQNEAAACEQFAEILIAGVGEVGHVVVAVNDQGEGEGSGAIGIPDAGIERELVHAETPVSFPKIGFPAGEVLKEGRGVDRCGFDCD